MASTDVDVKAESDCASEKALHVLDVTEVKLESDKCEVTAADDRFEQGNASGMVCKEKLVAKCHSLSVCCIHSVKKFLECDQTKYYFGSSLRLLSSGYPVHMILHSTRSLLEDFFLMSQCRNSLYCSKVLCGPTLAVCISCGRHFMGRGDRLLKLFNHIQGKHRLLAEELLLDMLKRYSALLGRMRKLLYMDQRLITTHFD